MKYRKYNGSDKIQVVALLNSCLARTKSNLITPESFQWKHFDQFFGGQTTAVVAVSGSQIASFVCFCPFEISDERSVWNCCIQATHPDFRRRGLVTALTKICEGVIQEKPDIQTITLIGFSNQSGLQIDQNSTKINHKVLGQFRQLILLPGSPQLVSNTNKIENITLLTWQKSTEYLIWKYDNNPRVKYQKLSIKNYTVYLTQSWFKVEIVDIVSLEIHDLTESLCMVINVIRTKFPLKVIVFCYLQNSLTSYITNQKAFGYINRNLPIWLTVRSSDCELLDVDNWLLFGGDIV